jgi:hypothetical protein
MVLAVVGFEAFVERDEADSAAGSASVPPDRAALPSPDEDGSAEEASTGQVTHRATKKKTKTRSTRSTTSTTAGSSSGSGSTATRGKGGGGAKGGGSGTGTGTTGVVTVPPTSAACGLLGVASVTVTWAAVPGATSYTLHYGDAGAETVEVTGTSHTITSLISVGTAWVVVHTDAGSSEPSNLLRYTVAAVSLCA